MSRADARDWHDAEKQRERDVQQLDEEVTRLYYYAEKRHQGPDPDTLRRLGYPEVADKVSKAYNLLSDAYTLLRNELP